MKKSTLVAIALSTISLISGADSLRVYNNCLNMVSRYNLNDENSRKAYYTNRCKQANRSCVEGSIALASLLSSLAIFQYRREINRIEKSERI